MACLFVHVVIHCQDEIWPDVFLTYVHPPHAKAQSHRTPVGGKQPSPRKDVQPPNSGDSSASNPCLVFDGLDKLALLGVNSTEFDDTFDPTKQGSKISNKKKEG